nr:MAG TPA: regulatory protein [Caudoviricetes sp.]
MNELTITNEEMTMTSTDIAKIVGTRHDNLMNDIRAMYADLYGENLAPEIQEQEYHKGKMRSVAIIDKKHTLCLVAKYSAKIRMKMIEKIESLEREVKVLKYHNSKMVSIDEVIEERQQKYRAIAAQHRIEDLYYSQSKVLDKILESEGSGSQIDDLVANIRIENNRYYDSQESVYSYQAQCEGLQMKLEVSKDTIIALTGKTHELLKLN